MRLSSWTLESLYTKESSINGGGLFTSAPIEAGTTVLVWGGVLVPYEEYDESIHKGRATTAFDEKFCLTDFVGQQGGVDEWLNHSCDANTWMTDARTVVARRDISAEEEVTTDFALWWHELDYVYTEQCGCSSEKCRTRITGGDWRNTAVQNQYRGHFVPFINKRIRKEFRRHIG